MTFEQAVETARTAAPAGGIGVLGEKWLHATLKWWLDEDRTHHEIPLPQGPVADIYDGRRVTEIQTAGFSAFRRKLERLLAHYPVTVVHPLVHRKWVVWVDPATGEATAPHKSPRVGGFADAGPELVYWLPLLGHENLTIQLVLVDVEECRLADGRRSRDGKRGSHRLERRPLALADTVTLESAIDYAALLPAGLIGPFTAKTFGRLAHQQGRRLNGTLKVLQAMNIIRRAGKEGKAYVYEI